MITTPEIQAEMLVANSKASNEALRQSLSTDKPNELEGNFGFGVPSTAPQTTIPTTPTGNDTFVNLKFKCCCDTTKPSESLPHPENAVGIYCLHTVQCYELPMKFSFLPNNVTRSVKPDDDDDDGHDDHNPRKYLADRKKCWPPPLFIIFISLIEIAVFVYDYMTVMPLAQLNTTSIPNESVLIYRPDRRLEIWRFLTYMTLHANCFHLAFNVIVQLLYGTPLEMVHGSGRIAVIYLAGVLAGSLGTSVIDSEVYLVGASGGVYALLAAQLANVMMNFGQMRNGILQSMAVLIFVFCDTAYAVYSHYLVGDNADIMIIIPSVSYIAHLTGSLAGFTIGLVVLKNFEHKCQPTTIRWLALAVFGAFALFTIAFNLMNTMAAQKLEEEGEIIKQHLLRGLGIS